MAINHYREPFPDHFRPHKCRSRMCQERATTYVKAQRLSRSQNYCWYTVGAYCGPCAERVIARARKEKT